MSKEFERTNTIIELMNLAGITEIKSAIDIGGDTGSIISELSTRLSLETAICADINITTECKNVTYLHIDESKNTLDVSDSSIDLVLALVSFHHLKNPDKLMSEINRISHKGTLLIIREHDAEPADQPYLDFIHLLEIIKRYGIKSKDFISKFHVSYFSRLGLRSSLEQAGWNYINSIDYPIDIPNPQKLYSSVFQYTGIGKSWLTPLSNTTEYTLKNEKLLSILDNTNQSNYIKALKKNGIYGKVAISLLQIRNLGFFISQFLKFYIQNNKK